MKLLRSPLLWITLLAALLRFWGVSDEGLWLDEGHTIKSIGQDYRHLADNWTQGALFLLIEKLFCVVAGTSEASLRFLPVVFGIAAVPLISLIAATLLGRRAGWIAALLLSVNSYSIFYSQDARPYTLFLLLSLCVFYCALKWADDGRWRYGYGLGTSLVLSAYTHPFAVFLLPAAVGVYWLHRSGGFGKPDLLRWAKLFAAMLPFALPQFWIIGQGVLHRVTQGVSGSWIAPASLYDFHSLVMRYSGLASKAAVLLSLVGIAVLAYTMIRRRSDAPSTRTAYVLLVWGGCTMLLPWLLSQVMEPFFVLRYSIPALAAWILFWAGIAVRLKMTFRIVLLALLVLFSGSSLYRMYTYQDKDPWRETATVLQQRVQSGDLIIVHPQFQRWVFDYYFAPPPGVVVSSLDLNESNDLSGSPGGSIWWVQGYRSPDVSLAARMEKRIIRDRVLREEIIMLNHFEPNPAAMYIADIRIRHFVPDSIPANPPPTE